MITNNDKIKLKIEINDLLINRFNLDINNGYVNSVSNVIINNWFNDLDNENSHLSLDMIAENIYLIIKRTCK